MKGTANCISFEEKPALAEEFLLSHIREKQHRASSYNQGKRDISHTPQRRVWKLPGSPVSSNPWMHPNPVENSLKISTLDFFTVSPLLYLGHRIQSCSFLPWCHGMVQGMSSAWKAPQTYYPYRRWHIGHGNALFAQAGKTAQGYFLQRRQKGHWMYSRKQEIVSYMVALHIHLCIQSPSPVPLCSGKPPLPVSHIDFSYHYGKDTNVLPLPLWALVCSKDFPLLERHSKSLLYTESVRYGRRKPSLQFQVISAHS